MASWGRPVADGTATVGTAAAVGLARISKESSTVARLAIFTTGSSSLGNFPVDHHGLSHHREAVDRLRKCPRWLRSRHLGRIDRRRGLFSVVEPVEDVVG